MAINFTKANKKQLLQIAQSEFCPLYYKYQACSELLKRRNKVDYVPQIVYLFGMGLLVPEIADALSISHMKVEEVINQKELWRTRLRKELQSKKPHNRGTAISFYKGKRACY
jgi:hypothetical protein